MLQLWQGQFVRTWGAEEAARAASSILAAAETRRTVEKLFQSADPPQSEHPSNAKAVPGADKRGGTAEVVKTEVSKSSLQSPVKTETATKVSVSSLAKGVSRLTLVSGAKRRSKEKQTAEEEKLAQGVCAWRDAFAARFKAEVGGLCQSLGFSTLLLFQCESVGLQLSS